MPRGYEPFEHTADAGAVVRGATLSRLFENAALALFDLMADRRTVRPRRRVRVAASADSLEGLLVRFLTEILYLHETRGLLFSSCRVERVDRVRHRAGAVLRGEPINRTRHRLRREVKAATWHQLHLVRGRSAWRVRIVFDV